MSKVKKIRIRRRGKTYSYNFDAGINPATGKRKQIEKGGYNSEQAAFDAGTAAYINWKHGNIGLISEKILIKDYLALWLQKKVKPNNKYATYTNYSNHIRLWINPFIGHIYLQDLRAADIDNMVQKLAASGKAMQTIKKTKSVLSNAINYAIYPAELISSNPTTLIHVPQNAPKKVVKRAVIPKTTIKNTMGKYPFGHKYHIPIMIALHTGMRISEILGLVWENIDLEVGKITVSQQLEKQQTLQYFSTPKTATSNREFYIDKFIIDELKKWKKYQASNEMKLGGAYIIIYKTNETVYGSEATNTTVEYKAAMYPKKLQINLPRQHIVCTDDLGKWIIYGSIESMLNNQMKSNSHSMRHTHATNLMENGAKIKDVSARLGHTQTSITENLYTHDTKQMQLETVKIIEENIVDK